MLGNIWLAQLLHVWLYKITLIEYPVLGGKEENYTSLELSPELCLGCAFCMLAMKAFVLNYPSISTLFSDDGLLVIAADKECDIAEGGLREGRGKPVGFPADQDFSF